tara:strand:+ start:471 stop:656 length:186 start_codon:yes stop_codon:yes gene_type:complete
MYILIYIIIGSALTSLWDWLLFGTKNQFTNVERAICILVWPAALGLYLYNLYNSFKKNNDE